MRLFVAVAFDSNVKATIAAFQAQLRLCGVSGSFTHEDCFHLTLKFLGEVDSGRLCTVKTALDKAALSVKPFDITAQNCGYFSSRGEKTAWLGFEGTGLDELAKAINIGLANVSIGLADIGFERENRAFTPHVTLARRAVCDSELIAHAGVPDVTFTVSAVTLFESRRDGGRLRYKPLYKAEL